MHFLQELRAANQARTVEWQRDATAPFSLTFWANELAGEVGEACNILKKLDREFNYKVPGSRASILALAEEFADVLICTDLVSMRLQIEFYPELCWPTRAAMAEPSYSMLGARIARDAGRVCGLALVDSPHGFMRDTLYELLYNTKSAAGLLGIDLEHATRSKFNMTSNKMGFNTKL